MDGRAPYEAARATLLGVLRARGVAPTVVAALGAVRREAFVRPEDRAQAYDDAPLPLAHGQTISQPLVVALMAQAAQVGPGARVLEVGAGSGYAAAVLAKLGAQVVGVERDPLLLAQARRTLGELGEEGVRLFEGDGSLGLPAEAPFDAIVVSAGGPRLPPALVAQLAPGGRLVMPVGPVEAQRLVRVTQLANGPVEEDLGPVRFVPLIGAEGWPETVQTSADQE